MLVMLCLLGYKLTADRMEIDVGDVSSVITLRGRVHIVSGDLEIFARAGTHRERDRFSTLWDSVCVHGPDYLIAADTLFHRPKPRFLELVGRALLEDSTRLIRSEHIVIRKDSAFATREVSIFIKEDKVKLEGDSAYYHMVDKKGYIVGSPQAFVYREDTVKVTAEKFLTAGDTLWATGDVSVTSGHTEAVGASMTMVGERGPADTTASADTSAAPDASVERILLDGGVSSSWEGGRGTSDSLLLTVVGGAVETAYFMGNATVVHSEGTGEGEVELAAERVRATIGDDGALTTVEAFGLGEGRYGER